ncbi:AMP-binding protein [Undibacterium sp. Jales W-56]|uniref:acyl-CoA synthetase n=1 Tax=Undibacterium sp. Jales W-56 TaxID=2897325 RepID=UPI0021D1803A|nr:AMP-binding protein [Undibacterium sp. Jales W-56]MCU6435423.1 AMP-binding protein [Undibacterium sp. Jales W-56]
MSQKKTYSHTPAIGAVDRYQELYQNFHWDVPAQFNIAEVCSQRWSKDSGRIAIHFEDAEGNTSSLSYAELQAQANQLSNLLREQGVQPGDIVAYILPQRPETAISVIACLQMGAIAMPLSFLFGPEALEYRLQNSEAVALIVDQSGIEAYWQIRDTCPALKTLITLQCKAEDALIWSQTVPLRSDRFDPVSTKATDPAILIYTSGTTGAPKGALLPHSAIIGNLTGFVASQNWFPQPGDVFWSPADWAWTGGLMDALLPTLYFGQPIVGYQGRFSSETAFYLMEKYQVTNTFLFPTALKMMMKACPEPKSQYRLKLRSIMSAGEAVGDAVFNWCNSALGIIPNEMFGQTEMNYIVGNSIQQWPAKPGSMGRPYPGHRVAIIDDDGNEVGAHQVGEVAMHRLDIHGQADPVFFLNYWKNPEATRNKFTGNWCRTGDLALRDEDGYLWYQGRADDMFKAAGYRIGPSEIENCLVKHPAVANAAVIPKPDKERGNVVKAYVVLSSGYEGNAELVAELQTHVRGKLAPYEYPREIEFIAALPMTTTGKVQRRVLRLLEEERAAAKI